MVELAGPVVDAGWLAAHLGQVRVVDVRWYLDGRSGRAAYETGHIPGAVFADLDTDLSAPPAQPGGRHPLPTPANFANAMSKLGIGDETPVVAYDDAGATVAGRLWWMLDSLGHPAAVLDGGIDAWSGPLEQAPVHPDRAEFTARPWPAERFVDASSVSGRSDSTVLIDARSSERYAGVENPIDPRFGHIPGAVNLPFGQVLDGSGRLRPVSEIADALADRGIAADTEVIAYCGSGVSACLDLLAIRLAHGSTGRLYVGSWSEWGADKSRPVEVDRATPPA